MLAAAILAAVHQVTRGRGERIVRAAERADLAVAVVVHAHVEPDFRHPLRVAHGARPGAAHLLGRAPTALDDDECVEQFLLPIGATARLAPRERRERGDDRAHVVLLHVRIAEGRFDAPEPEHDPAVDPVVLLDAGKERRVFLRLLLAGRDAPVGDAAIEILPELFVEFGLEAIELKNCCIRSDTAHNPRVCSVGYATRARPCAKRRDPLVERRFACLRACRCVPRRHAHHQHGEAGSP